VACWTIGEGEQEGQPEVKMAVMRLVGTEGEHSSNWEELHRSAMAAMAMAPAAVERRRARTCAREEEEWGALSGLSKTQEGAAVARGARGGARYRCMEATSRTLVGHYGISPNTWWVMVWSGWDAFLGPIGAKLDLGPKSKVATHIMLYKFH
jgi:hypothetical protein